MEDEEEIKEEKKKIEEGEKKKVRNLGYLHIDTPEDLMEVNFVLAQEITTGGGV